MDESRSRHIVIAEPHGFCAGVHRAVGAIEGALALFSPPIYCLNEIVHNRQVVDDLSRRGVVFVTDLAEVPKGSHVVFSAHGVSPAVRELAQARGLDVLDATCPFVQKIHNDVKRFVQQDYEVLLIGHRGHDEIVGIQGEAPHQVIVIENEDEARRVTVRNPDRVATVTQTTLSVDQTAHIIDVLRERFPGLQAPSTDGICQATISRQDAVKRLAGKVDIVLVLGSTNSSNTRRLVEVARAAGLTAHLVDTLDALAAVPLEDIASVGLTAGASTPDSFSVSTIDWLKQRGFDTVQHMPEGREEPHFVLPRELRRAMDKKEASAT